MPAMRLVLAALVVVGLTAALFAGVPSGLLGIAALAGVGLHLWVRSRGDGGYADLAADLLAGVWPGLSEAILARDRTARWSKTSRSSGPQRVWGYADRHSIDPGDSFRLCLAAEPGRQGVSGHIEVARIGHHRHLRVGNAVAIKGHTIWRRRAIQSARNNHCRHTNFRGEVHTRCAGGVPPRMREANRSIYSCNVFR